MRTMRTNKFAAAAVLFIMTVMLSIVPAFAGIKLNKKTVNLYTGQAVTLRLKGTKKAPKWSSSKKAVVSVDKSGRILAKKKGTAIIKAKLKGKTYTCRVNVKENAWKFKGNIGVIGNWTNLAFCNQQTWYAMVSARTYSMKYDRNGNLVAQIAVNNMTPGRNYILTDMEVQFTLDGTVIAEGYFRFDEYLVQPLTYGIVTVTFDNGGTKQGVNLRKDGDRIRFAIATN